MFVFCRQVGAFHADVDNFEKAFRHYLGAEAAATFPSARIAFYYALRALNLPPGSVVALTPIAIPDFVSAIRGANLSLRVQERGGDVTVRVPPGAGDGDKVRVAGHGAPGMGGPAGDLVLTIRVSPHPVFERKGLDLHLDLPITVAEAHRGAKVRVPTPDGEVSLTVPKHAQSGKVVRLAKKGVKRGNQHGDLYVRFLVKLPESDSAEVERAVDALEAATAGDVRAGIRF